MIDKVLEDAVQSYHRPCPHCGYKFGMPDVDDLIENELKCPECGSTYPVDGEDMRFLVALLLCRIERLENRTRNPFAGAPI